MIEQLTRAQALHLLELGLNKNLQRAPVPVEPRTSPSQGETSGEAQEGTEVKRNKGALHRSLKTPDPDSCGPLQSPLEQELHKLERKYGLGLTESLWMLSHWNSSGLEVQPPTYGDELWED